MSSMPLILIYQEIAQPTATPVTPDLRTIILGPAYNIVDYPEDAATNLLDDVYGDLEPSTTYVPPISGEIALTINDQGYPGQSAGAVVDHTSVRLHLRSPRVVMGSTVATLTVAPILGTNVTTSSSDQTLITFTGTGDTLVDAGIQPGDRIILCSSAGQECARTVASIGDPNAAGLIPSGNERILRVTAALPTAGSGSTEWTYNSTGEARIERTLATTAFSDPTGTYVTFPDAGTDKMELLGGITLSVSTTARPTVDVPSPKTSTVTLPVIYAQIYVSYRARRQDLQAVGTATSTSITTSGGMDIITGLGRVDARNPLATGVWLALQNAGTSAVYYWGVAADTPGGYAAARARLASRRDLYCFVILSTDINVIAAFNTAFVQQADPTHAAEVGVAQAFRIVLGSVPLPTDSLIYSDSVSGVSAAISGSSTEKYRTLVISSASTGSEAQDSTLAAQASLEFASVLPGDLITIGLIAGSTTQWLNRRGTHRIGHVNANFDPSTIDGELEIIPSGARWNDAAVAGSDDIEFEIRAPDGTLKAQCLASRQIDTGSGGTLGGIRYDMKKPTTVGGPYTIQYVAGSALAISISGFTITITIETSVTTHAALAAAVNAHSVLSTLMAATAQSGGGYSDSAVVAPASQSPSGAVGILPGTGVCTATIAENDDLYNRFNDASATFLTSDVRPGDLLEIPIDPNNYLSDAFSGRLLTYTIGQVLSETGLKIANALDDTADAANELPHFYKRDFRNQLLDNTAPSAQNYRIRRVLSTTDQVIALAATPAGIRSKRCILGFPDLCKVANLYDGSLPRSTPTTRARAGWVSGAYLLCALGGVIGATPAQMGLTGGTLIGFDELRHSTEHFTEEELAQISDAGFFLFQQSAPGALPEVVHQLTTDVTVYENAELSIVKNIDFISMAFATLLKRYLGRYNAIAESFTEIESAVADNVENLRSRKLAQWGAPLISATLDALTPAPSAPDTAIGRFTAKVPGPLNRIAFHIVTTR